MFVMQRIIAYFASIRHAWSGVHSVIDHRAQQVTARTQRLPDTELDIIPKAGRAPWIDQRDD